MKIVLAVDGSAYTKRMLSYIAAHDELVGKDHEFVALNVTEALPPHVIRFLQTGMPQSFYADEAEKVLRPVREFALMQGWRLRERHADALRDKDALAAAMEARIAQLTTSSTELQSLHKEDMKRIAYVAGASRLHNNKSICKIVPVAACGACVLTAATSTRASCGPCASRWRRRHISHWGFCRCLKTTSTTSPSGSFSGLLIFFRSISGR